MTPPAQTVSQHIAIVDDDDAVRRSIGFLFDSVRISWRAYESGPELLAEFDTVTPQCVLSDIRMPAMSGLELLDVIAARDPAVPVILITGHGDVPMAVRALKAGATDFIEKPFNDEDLLGRVRRAAELAAGRRREQEVRLEAKLRLSTLSPRESEVFQLVVGGSSNKQIAAVLGLSEKTVELHRSNVMRKSTARGLADLVKIAIAAEAVAVGTDPAFSPEAA
jgi:two-component system response regulator FixJ